MRLPSLRALSFCIAIGAFVLVAVGAPSGQSGAPPAGGRTAPAATTTAPAAMRETSHTLLNRYCVSCHNDAVKTANLSLQGVDLANVPADAAVWEKVIRKLRAGVMPPPGMPRPPLPEYEGLRDWLEGEIDRAAASTALPGTVVLHRLNRTEYANAIRDLLDLDVDVAALLPPDDAAHGFDNIAGSLTISPTLLESYTTAAARIARMAVGYWRSPAEATYLTPGDASQNHRLEGMPFGTRGGIVVRHTFPADGEYRFSIQNFGIGSFVPGEQLALIIDGERAHVWPYRGVGVAVGMTADSDGTLEVAVPVRAGSRLVGATFLATNYRPSLDIIRHYDRKSLENNTIPQLQNYPAIGFVRIEGPFHPQRPDDSPSRRKVFTCRPQAPSDEAVCARDILTRLARLAYRRPPTASELDTIMGFFDEGRADGAFDDGIEFGLRFVLASPQFLVRAEREPADVRAGDAYRITDIELASRLSFFLWSSIPDDELIELATAGSLREPAVLERQVRRMLRDPRSEALVTNFGQQWLYLRNLPATSPDGIFYPNWDHELRQSLQRESELFFESIIREDRNVVDLLDADYTFVNERLARHYGIPNVYGARFRRVTLPAELDDRRGLLGKGSFLSVTWTENFRTSPVKRGVWVLENILGTPPPEPPPDVPALEETAGSDNGHALTLREQMTLHRASPTCAGCHMIMDPIGFALENFDADGSWRTRQGGDGGSPLDTAVSLFDGQEVGGPSDLRRALLRYSPQFVQMFVEKLMTYALSRGVEYPDMPAVRAIARDVARDDNRFSAIVLGVVRSAQFQMRARERDGGAHLE